MKSIVWIRNNLRLSDNYSLTEAAREGAVLPVYLWDPSLDIPPDGARKWWRQGSLRALASGFERYGVRMCLLRGSAEEILPALARRSRIGTIRACEGRTLPERQQDERVERALSDQGIRFVRDPDDYLVTPDFFPEGRKDPWKICTPFWRRIRAELLPERPLPAPSRIDGVPVKNGDSLEEWGWDPDWAKTMRTLWTPGEASAARRLDEFVTRELHGYAVRRDFPLEGGSSRLSPHLADGEVSQRQIWWKVEEAGAPGEDREKFLSEIGWREFSAHLLRHFPDLAELPLRTEFLSYPWKDDGPEIAAWQRGETGYPIVDAGMRELRLTGWMPNRVRMVAASFLVKNLGVSWKAGLSWFADNLIDYDPASNAASWQWVAGCGTDAAPFSRVFNPVLQGERFDPRGEYVRRFIPELSGVPDRFVHTPWLFREHHLSTPPWWS